MRQTFIYGQNNYGLQLSLLLGAAVVTGTLIGAWNIATRDSDNISPNEQSQVLKQAPLVSSKPTLKKE